MYANKLEQKRSKSNLNDKYLKTIVNNYPDYTKQINYLTSKRNNNKSLNCTKYKLKNNNKIIQSNLINKFNQSTNKKPEIRQKNKLPDIRKSFINPNSVINKGLLNINNNINNEKNIKPTIIKETDKIQNIDNTKIVIDNIDNSNNTNIIYVSNEKNINKNGNSYQSSSKEDMININNNQINNSYMKSDLKLNNAQTINNSSNIPKNIEIKNIIPNGLQNEGEPLCMNAILQCFANIKSLTQKILYYNSTNKLNNCELAKAYEEVLENLWIKENILFSPTKIRNIIKIKNNLNLINGKIEPEKLVSFLLDNLHKELNRPVQDKNIINVQNPKLKFSGTLSNFFNSFQKNYKSIISALFCGGFVSKTICQQCKNTSNNTSVFNMLKFSLQQIFISITGKEILNIYDCFEYSKNPMFLKKCFCNKCKIHCLPVNETKILYTPKIMIINLSMKNNLINFNIEFNLEEFIDIKKYIIQNECIPACYELIGIVCRLVSIRIYKNKYIAFCKNFMNKKWYKYDDTNITESSFDKASKNGIPCILFYSYIKK